MADNILVRLLPVTWPVVVTDPAAPAVGDPVRFGSLTGIAMLAEGAGGVGATQTVVDFGLYVADHPVNDHVGGGIAVGDTVYYVDAADRLENDTSGTPYGIALETVGAGATTTINVLHVPAPQIGAGLVNTAALAAGVLSADAAGRAKVAAGFFDEATVLDKFAADSFDNAELIKAIKDGAFNADANTRALFDDGIWTEGKLAPAGMTGTIAAVVANANVIGGLPVLFRIDCADASANVDVVSTHKIRVLDAWALNTGIAAHAANDTWQVKNGANAISDAVAKTAVVNAIKRISTIDPAQAEIAAGGTLRVTTVKDTNAAVTVYVLAIRVA